jgi:hypothetical protein
MCTIRDLTPIPTTWQAHDSSEASAALVVAATCALLLGAGRYRPVERLFTLCTIGAVLALQLWR